MSSTGNKFLRPAPESKDEIVVNLSPDITSERHHSDGSEPSRRDRPEGTSSGTKDDPAGEPFEEKGPLDPFRNEIKRCVRYLTERIQTSNKKSKGFRVAAYVFLCISLALDFAPAFIPALQNNYYSIATVSFSLVCLILDIYRDSAEYEASSVRDEFTIISLNSVRDSIERKDGSVSPDYLKRISEKTSHLKMGAHIPEPL